MSDIRDYVYCYEHNGYDSDGDGRCGSLESALRNGWQVDEVPACRFKKNLRERIGSWRVRRLQRKLGQR